MSFLFGNTNVPESLAISEKRFTKGSIFSKNENTLDTLYESSLHFSEQIVDVIASSPAKADTYDLNFDVMIPPPYDVEDLIKECHDLTKKIFEKTDLYSTTNTGNNDTDKETKVDILRNQISPLFKKLIDTAAKLHDLLKKNIKFSDSTKNTAFTTLLSSLKKAYDGKVNGLNTQIKDNLPGFTKQVDTTKLDTFNAFIKTETRNVILEIFSVACGLVILYSSDASIQDIDTKILRTIVTGITLTNKPDADSLLNNVLTPLNTAAAATARIAAAGTGVAPAAVAPADAAAAAVADAAAAASAPTFNEQSFYAALKKTFYVKFYCNNKIKVDLFFDAQKLDVDARKSSDATCILQQGKTDVGTMANNDRIEQSRLNELLEPLLSLSRDTSLPPKTCKRIIRDIQKRIDAFTNAKDDTKFKEADDAFDEEIVNVTGKGGKSLDINVITAYNSIIEALCNKLNKIATKLNITGVKIRSAEEEVARSGADVEDDVAPVGTGVPGADDVAPPVDAAAGTDAHGAGDAPPVDAAAGVGNTGGGIIQAGGADSTQDEVAAAVKALQEIYNRTATDVDTTLHNVKDSFTALKDIEYAGFIDSKGGLERGNIKPVFDSIQNFYKTMKEFIDSNNFEEIKRLANTIYNNKKNPAKDLVKGISISTRKFIGEKLKSVKVPSTLEEISKKVDDCFTPLNSENTILTANIYQADEHKKRQLHFEFDLNSFQFDLDKVESDISVPQEGSTKQRNLLLLNSEKVVRITFKNVNIPFKRSKKEENGKIVKNLLLLVVTIDNDPGLLEVQKSFSGLKSPEDISIFKDSFFPKDNQIFLALRNDSELTLPQAGSGSSDAGSDKKKEGKKILGINMSSLFTSDKQKEKNKTIEEEKKKKIEQDKKFLEQEQNVSRIFFENAINTETGVIDKIKSKKIIQKLANDPIDDTQVQQLFSDMTAGKELPQLLFAIQRPLTREAPSPDTVKNNMLLLLDALVSLTLDQLNDLDSKYANGLTVVSPDSQGGGAPPDESVIKKASDFIKKMIKFLISKNYINKESESKYINDLAAAETTLGTNESSGLTIYTKPFISKPSSGNAAGADSKGQGEEEGEGEGNTKTGNISPQEKLKNFFLGKGSSKSDNSSNSSGSNSSNTCGNDTNITCNGENMYVTLTLNIQDLLNQCNISPEIISDKGYKSDNGDKGGKLTSEIEGNEFTPAQIGKMTVEQVGALTSEDIGKMTVEHVQAFTPDQIGKMTVDQVQSFTPDHIKAMKDEQVQSFTPAHIKAMKVDQVQSFTPDHIKAMKDEQVQSFTPDHIKAMKDEQVQSFTTDHLGAMSNDQVEAFTPEHIGAMKVEQKTAVDKVKVAARAGAGGESKAGTGTDEVTKKAEEAEAEAKKEEERLKAEAEVKYKDLKQKYDDIKAKINSHFDIFIQQLAILTNPPIKDSQQYDSLKKKYTEMKQRINVMFDNILREITDLATQPIDTD